MPRSCSVCGHPHRDAIDAALESGQSLRTVAGQFAVAKSSVDRHQKHCHASGHTASAAAPTADMPQHPADTPHTTTLRLSLEAQVALAAYHNTVDAYEEMRQRDWKRMAMAPYVVLTPLWRQVEVAKQRCRALGIDPERRVQ